MRVETKHKTRLWSSNRIEKKHVQKVWTCTKNIDLLCLNLKNKNFYLPFRKSLNFNKYANFNQHWIETLFMMYDMFIYLHTNFVFIYRNKNNKAKVYYSKRKQQVINLNYFLFQPKIQNSLFSEISASKKIN
jgi:hypothetical protein